MNYQYENYEEKKCSYIWDLLLVFLAIFFFIYFTIILIYKFLLKDNCTCIEKLFKSPENVISQNPVIVNAQENKKIKKNKNEIQNENNENKNEIKNENENTKKMYNNFIHISEKDPGTQEKLILKKRKKEIKSPCSVCLSNESSVIISPCGHRCICLNCYNAIKTKIKICPICRKT